MIILIGLVLALWGWGYRWRCRAKMGGVSRPAAVSPTTGPRFRFRFKTGKPMEIDAPTEDAAIKKLSEMPGGGRLVMSIVEITKL